MNYLKKHKDLIILNYVLLIIYYLFFSSLHLDINGGIMFTTYDSYTYQNASEEFYKFSEQGFSNFRPFLYPLLIILILKPLGPMGLWLMQVLFWGGSINLIYLALKNITQHQWMPLLASAVFALNFSFLGLTMQCLTETTTLFLVSILVYFSATKITQRSKLQFIHSIIFLFVLLTVLKPVFYLPLLFLLFIILPAFYRKQYIKSPKQLTILVLTLLPLFYQLTLMKVKYNTLTVSQISTETFRNYLFAQGFQENNSISLAEARTQIKNMTDSEVNTYFIKNSSTYLRIYFQNLKANMNAFTSFLLGPRGFIYTGWATYMKIINTIYYWMHLLFSIPVIVLTYSYFKNRKWETVCLLLGCLLFCYYIFFSSPVSFNEGDRLIITSMPCWIFLYTFSLDLYWKKFKNLT